MLLWPEFRALVEEIVWCTVATVDTRNRPRSRVLHPIWEFDGEAVIGSIATGRTPLKDAHLRHSPYVSCSYVAADQRMVYAECGARWLDDAAEKRRIWNLLAGTPPPVGYDPAPFFPAGPDHPSYTVLRLEPWRITVTSLRDLVTGTPDRVWTA
jgi:hypothetical protein